MEIMEVTTRQTKYCSQIEEIISQVGHASNAQILEMLQKTYPDVSATTVHRATARLASRGEIGIAPSDRNGAMRYDANISPHDHFLCMRCGLLKDIDVADRVSALLKQTVEDCGISGRITITGTCKACSQEVSI